MRPVALAMPAVIERNDPVIPRQRFDHPRVAPIPRNVGHIAMDKYYRLAAAFDDVVDFHAGGIEKEVLRVQSTGQAEWNQDTEKATSSEHAQRIPPGTKMKN